MAERKVIHVEPGGEVERLLRLIGDEPVSVEAGGKRFTIEREQKDLLEDYDPAKALEGLRSLAGLFSDIDVEAFKRETLENREQDSLGRPADR